MAVRRQRSCPRPGWLPSRKGDHGWFPSSLHTGSRIRCPTLPRQHRQWYAAGLPTGLLPVECVTVTELTTAIDRWWSRTAHQPISTRLELAHRLRGIKRRFLSYTFPRCLPDPACLVVPDRPVVVRTAPTLTGVSRIRLSSASPASCDWPVEGLFHPLPVLHSSVSKLTWNYSASWRTASSTYRLASLRWSSGIPARAMAACHTRATISEPRMREVSSPS